MRRKLFWITVVALFAALDLYAQARLYGALTVSTLSASGQITSTVSTGTPPLVIASTTAVANLNASSLGGATFAAPGAIGGGTPSTGAFTTSTASGSYTSPLFTQSGANPATTGIFNLRSGFAVCWRNSGNTGDDCIQGGQANSLFTINGGIDNNNHSLTAGSYKTSSNCADSAGPAACGDAAAGSFVIDAAATTVVVSTTALTAASEVFVQYDSSLGTRLSVTCNTTVALPSVTARSAGTSFTVTVPVAPTVNPACYSYRIIN